MRKSLLWMILEMSGLTHVATDNVVDKVNSHRRCSIFQCLQDITREQRAAFGVTLVALRCQCVTWLQRSVDATRNISKSSGGSFIHNTAKNICILQFPSTSSSSVVFIHLKFIHKVSKRRLLSPSSFSFLSPRCCCCSVSHTRASILLQQAAQLSWVEWVRCCGDLGLTLWH